MFIGLSASGTAPATHSWFNAAFTNSELKLLMQRLCVLSGIAAPATWDTMTRQQKKQWLLGQRGEIRTTIGIGILAMDNDGAWDDPTQELAAAGLQAVRTGAP